jgi:uncharacterized protein (DUF58 family)
MLTRLAGAGLDPMAGLHREGSRPLAWQPSHLASRLATIGVLGIALGLVVARSGLMVIAAPSLVALVLVLGRGSRPDEVELAVSVSEEQCLEGEELELRVRVRSPARLGLISVVPQLGDEFEVTPLAAPLVRNVSEAVFSFRVVPLRWGKKTLSDITISARTLGLGWTAQLEISVYGLRVLPSRVTARDLAIPAGVLTRMGQHVGRRPGPGMEFLGTREYAAGDSVRAINWPASSRTRQLIVNQYASERSSDVVVFVDLTTEVEVEGCPVLEASIRIAASLAQAYLEQGDRVGLVGFGARLRWVAPRLGAEAYHRIMDEMLAAAINLSFVEPSLTRLPRSALPTGALVFVVSPLLERAVLDSIADLRRRGHAVIVIDMIGVAEPSQAQRASELSWRIWRMEREALLSALTDLGVARVPWGEPTEVSFNRLQVSSAQRRSL